MVQGGGINRQPIPGLLNSRTIPLHVSGRATQGHANDRLIPGHVNGRVVHGGRSGSPGRVIPGIDSSVQMGTAQRRFHSEPPILKQAQASADLTSADVLSIGLSFVGFDRDRQARVNLSTNNERFKAHYGIPTLAVAIVYNDMRAEFDDIIMKDFFMTLNWFKCYDVEHVLAGRWQYCEKYIRERVKDYTKRMQSFKQKKIVFGGFDEREEYPYSLDGVHFPCEEFTTDPSSKWYTHKHNCSGLVSRNACAFI